MAGNGQEDKPRVNPDGTPVQEEEDTTTENQ